MTAAFISQMEKEIRLCLNARLLLTDEGQMRNLLNLMKELEDKGFLKDSRIIFDSMQEDEVYEIFNRYAAITPNSKTEVK